MTEKIDKFLEKISAFHDAVKKADAVPPAQDNGCPEGQERVDGECVPIEKTKEKPMTESKVEPKKEETKGGTPAPTPAVASTPAAPAAVPTPTPETSPNPEAQAVIDQLKNDMKEQSAMLSAITEKVAGVVLNAEVKGQAETLRNAIDNVNKLASSLTSALPKPEVHVKVVPFQSEKPVDMTPGFRSGAADFDELSDRYMRKWGVEIPPEEELELPKPKVEEDPVKAELASLKAESKSHSAQMKEVADKLSGLIATLSARPTAPIAPANPNAPIIPVVAQGKKSESYESGMETVHWDASMSKGKSFEERARLIQERLGIKETA